MEREDEDEERVRVRGRQVGKRNRKEDLEDVEEEITGSHRSLPGDRSQRVTRGGYYAYMYTKEVRSTSSF